MERFKVYVESILKGSFINKYQKEELIEELLDHLELLKDDYVNEGYSIEEAEEMAIKTFGKSKKIKNEFRKFSIWNNKINIVAMFSVIFSLIPLLITPFYMYPFGNLTIYSDEHYLFGVVAVFFIKLVAYYQYYIVPFFVLIISIGLTKIFAPKQYYKTLIITEIIVVSSVPISVFMHQTIFKIVEYFNLGDNILLYCNLNYYIYIIISSCIIISMGIFIGRYLYRITEKISVALIPLIISVACKMFLILCLILNLFIDSNAIMWVNNNYDFLITLVMKHIIDLIIVILPIIILFFMKKYNYFNLGTTKE